jgi:hypothetical protein
MILNKNFFNLKVLILALILILIFYRSPYIILNGRFISEEGYIFFKNSYENGPIQGFFQIFWETGYLNLWANIGSILALVPSLEYAPIATVYLALSLKIYIFIFILYSDSEFFQNLRDKFFLCFIVLLSPVMVPNIWLNTLNSMSYFGILTILIFFQRNKTKNFYEKISPYILLLSGLSSLYSAILAPFFLLKYYFNKNKINYYNFVAISFSAIIQFSIIIYAKFNSFIFEYKTGISLVKLISYCYNVIVKSFFGREVGQILTKQIININQIKILSILFIILSIFFIYFIIKEKDKILNFLILILITESFFVLIGSSHDQVGGRYAVVPGILFLLITYRLFQINQKILKFIFMIMIINSLILGTYEFKFKTKNPRYLKCINCPVWKEEVKKWKIDNDYIIQIWNYPGKSMTLKNNY